MVDRAIKYSKNFIGMEYKRRPNSYIPNPKSDTYPFWIANRPPPAINYIYKRGSSCAGLINLIRRYMGLEVPGHITGFKNHFFIGGTGAWFEYLKKTKRLEKIDFSKIYPKGTLLIQDFNPENQGHVAFTVNSSKKGLLHSKIMHNVPLSKKRVGDCYTKYNKVLIEKLEDYIDHKRFTHICLPKDWLLKN